MAIVLFLSCITLIGVIVFMIGLVTSFLLSFLPIGFMFQNLLTILFISILYFGLNQFILKHVKKMYELMKMNFKALSSIENYAYTSLLSGLMLLHFYALHFVLTKMSFSIEFIAVSLFTSLLFGFTVKGIVDNIYQIKLTKEGDSYIFEG